MQVKLLGMTCFLSAALPASAEDRSASIDGARAVVAAIVREADVNAKLPRPGTVGAPGPFRVSGDALTERYVRAAAGAARKLSAERSAEAFLIALGLTLDDSTILRKNPLTATLFAKLESDAERRQRLAVLGSPTLRGRRDLAQHFVVSCTLTEVVGSGLAESAGLLKEQLDMVRGSGFSFADLNADFAGVHFAQAIKKGDIPLAALEKGFKVTHFVPDHTGLREGLNAAQFAKDFGSTEDPRFLGEIEKMRKRIQSMPGYQRE